MAVTGTVKGQTIHALKKIKFRVKRASNGDATFQTATVGKFPVGAQTILNGKVLTTSTATQAWNLVNGIQAKAKFKWTGSYPFFIFKLQAAPPAMMGTNLMAKISVSSYTTSATNIAVQTLTGIGTLNAFSAGGSVWKRYFSAGQYYSSGNVQVYYGKATDAANGTVKVEVQETMWVRG